MSIRANPSASAPEPTDGSSVADAQLPSPGIVDTVASVSAVSFVDLDLDEDELGGV